MIVWRFYKIFIHLSALGWGLGFGVVGLLFILLPLFFTPYCYIFDSEGVSFHYVFLQVERYLWENVRDITVEYSDFARGSSASLLEFFYGKVFHIEGANEGPCRFYMTGNIRKTFRTKRLLEEYKATFTEVLSEIYKNGIEAYCE